MSQSQPCTTTVTIAHSGHGLVTLTVGVRMVAEFFGERNAPYLRRPFREYSFASALGTRAGSRKVTGEYVVGFAAELGVSEEEAWRVVNETLACLGWPELVGREHP